MTYLESDQREVLRRRNETQAVLEADICIVGGGIAGIYAALASASLGRRVVLADGASQLGGLTYNANIGSFCGFYSNGPNRDSCHPLTRIFAEEMFDELKELGGIFPRYSSRTVVVPYYDLCFLRWAEHKMQSLGVRVLLGCLISGVHRDGRRLKEVQFLSRYGTVRVQAESFLDASGDAALAWAADIPCQESTSEVLGSQVFLLGGVDCSNPPTTEEINCRAAQVGVKYGLERLKGVFFYMPIHGGLLSVNMTHIPTPLDPVAASEITLTSKDLTDQVAAFLRSEFPQSFGAAEIVKYGETGIRQTRSVAATHRLTTQEVLDGTVFSDRIARCAWPIELHNESTGYVWHTFPDDHIHYIPLASLLSPELDNYAAAGRCIDADTAALSSVRVMGPCAATGTAAAYALALAGNGSVHQIDLARLQQNLAPNLQD